MKRISNRKFIPILNRMLDFFSLSLSHPFSPFPENECAIEMISIAKMMLTPNQIPIKMAHAKETMTDTMGIRTECTQQNKKKMKRKAGERIALCPRIKYRTNERKRIKLKLRSRKGNKKNTQQMNEKRIAWKHTKKHTHREERESESWIRKKSNIRGI